MKQLPQGCHPSLHHVLHFSLFFKLKEDYYEVAYTLKDKTFFNLPQKINKLKMDQTTK